MKQAQAKLDLLTAKKVGTKTILYQDPPISPFSLDMLAYGISRSEIVAPKTHTSQGETDEVVPCLDTLVESPSLLEATPELLVEEVILSSPLSRFDIDDLEKAFIPPHDGYSIVASFIPRAYHSKRKNPPSLRGPSQTCIKR
eukprot:Gb_18876 [translate_table: standard]